jgi:hypothetical protein
MINFKKISALVTSGLMVGLTAGVAAAANYPAPFVVGGSADVAVVYGTGSGVSVLDAVEAGNIQTDLQSYMGSSGSDSGTTTSGETVSLDTSATRIWLNTSLDTAKSTLTKTDLPTVLGENTFSGNVDAKLTSTIKVGAGAAAGGDGSSKVIFAKQPSSSDDPVIGISLGSSASRVLYNASVTMKAVNFTNSDSEGETITLFGREFVVSTATDTTDLVLFSSAEEIDLVAGGSNPSTTATVNIDGSDYTVELVTGTSTTATVAINGDQREVNEGSSKKIGGIEVAVKSVTESTALDTVTATLLVGSEKITFTNGQVVTKGENDDPVDGTIAYIVGGTGSTTELAVGVYRPDSSNDAIVPGETFVDPVFGSFQVDFAGLSSPLDDTSRSEISVQNSGDDTMSVTLTDYDGNSGTIDFAHNATAGSINYKPANWRLADDSNYSLYAYEMANLTENDYVVLGNEDYGHLVQVTQLYNNSGDYTNNKVRVQDVLSGTTYDSVFTGVCTGSSSCGTVSIDGKAYNVIFNGLSGDDGWVQFKYPTSDSAGVATFVTYPTIKTEGGALVAFYEPLTVTLDDFNKSGTDYTSITFRLPNGDGYTSAVFTENTANNWTLTGGTTLSTSTTYATNQTVNKTVGQLEYTFMQTATADQAQLYLIDPESTAVIGEPALIIFEPKDDNNAYEAVVVDLEGNAASMGSSTNGVGVEDVYFTTAYGHYSASMASDSDITKDVDWFGTLTVKDSDDSDQKTVTVSVPESQVYTQIYLGEIGSSVTSSSTVTGAAQLGDVLVKDSEVSSVSSKNLIIVGGSCINTAASTVLGGVGCGASFTETTGVGSGEFLIESVGDAYTSGKVALVVAGYEAADTVNAAKYLRTQKPDTAAGMKYKGTTSTSAELVVE